MADLFSQASQTCQNVDFKIHFNLGKNPGKQRTTFNSKDDR